MNDLSTWRIDPALTRILLETPELGCAYLVGGCVRDALLDLPGKDYDVEVFGLDADALVRTLSRWGRVDVVGQSFGVVKLTVAEGDTYDFSLPRRDSKVASGHRGFEVQFDATLDPEAASARRDYTVNALMFDVRRRELLDYQGGLADLKNRVLRHVGPAFAEDPLRVLRGMYLAARLGFDPAPETVDLCRSIKASYAELAVERVREEWFKWAARGRVPSAGLRFLAATEWLDHFPEIQAMSGVGQDPEWHPEGDVLTHTGHCCDALALDPGWRAADAETRVVLMLAVLLHDSAKPLTTQSVMRDGRMRIVSPGHDVVARSLVDSFLGRLRAPQAILQRVPPLVAHHLAHLNPITDKSVRRLAKRLEPETIEHLGRVIAADYAGRPPRPPVVSEAVRQLLAKADEMRVAAQAPQPILRGRHLIEWGLLPGPAMGQILAAAFEAQLDGEFQDLEGARLWFGRR